MRKRNLLWLKILSLCIFFHLLILLWVFCVYRENNYLQIISINKKLDYNAPIYFMPCHVSAPTTTAKTLSPKPMVRTTTQSKPVATSLCAAPKPSVVKAACPTPTKTPAPIKPATTANKAEIKKTEVKKTEPITPPALEKKPIPTMIPEKKIEPPKVSAPATPPAIAPQPIESAPAAPQTIKPVSDAQRTLLEAAITPQEHNSAMNIPDGAQVSNNYREVEALRRGALLQKELVQKWHPPMGVSADCCCDISFFVNKKGGIQHLKMLKNSGIMMFDISARQALFSMKMPQWTHGNALIISFKQ